jgi:hypothetical protein
VYIFIDLVNDLGVLPGNAYVVDTTVTPGGGGGTCVEDGLEENDTQGTATVLNPPSTDPAQNCLGDDDWFEVTLAAGDTIEFDVLFLDGEGNIDIFLVDSAGTPITDSQTTTDDEYVSYLAPSAEIVSLQVTLTADAGSLPGNAYAVTSTLTPATGGCVDDLLENNDTLGTSTATTAPYAGVAIACLGDEDWYSIPLNSGDTLTVDLTFFDIEGNLDVYLLNSGTVTQGSGTSATDDELITFTAANTATYYVFVDMLTDTGVLPGNAYTLDLTVVPGGGGGLCVDDGAEENDSLGAAMGLSTGITPSLVSCPSDDDWFSFTPGSGDAITLDVLHAFADGNIDATLHDSSGPVVASSSITDDETINWTAANTSTHYLEVVMTNDTGATPGNSYDVSFSLTPTGGGSCVADTFEPNNSQGSTAIIVPPTNEPNLNACLSDEDWFDFSVAAGDTVTVSLTFPHAEGDINVEVLDGSSTVLASGTSGTDNELITYTSPSINLLFIKVELATDTGAVVGNGYTLDVTIAP